MYTNIASCIKQICLRLFEQSGEYHNHVTYHLTTESLTLHPSQCGALLTIDNCV